MLAEKDFYQYCETELSRLFEELETLDKNSNFDIDYADGILKIVLQGGKTYVINRNSGNQKIWYSSPISGADYFAFNLNKKIWENEKNQELAEKLLSEIKIFL